ncbi:related to cyclin dependent kinase C [Ustilago trichophora]|uniref:Related to cyclin dependent kinase C n=1 Tax=Ustilago trichophora TaxID=86804 RepID=A0A5C3E0F2_9BASI|nr:related to cyclin dependent kinase C [Ustilago trichophora]
MPPRPSDQEAMGGFRIAGIAASRAASSSNSSVAPSPSPAATREDKAPIKLDRDRHGVHRLPVKPASQSRAGDGQSRPWPQRPNAPQQQRSGSSSAGAAAATPYTDDEEEEGAIDDSPTSALESGFRPPPPKTPPHPSTTSNSRPPSEGHHRIDRDRHSNSRRDDYKSYQPQSPPKPKAQATASASYQAQASHLRSPSPQPAARRSSRDFDSGPRPPSDQRHHRQPSDRSEHDVYRPGGNGAGASSRDLYRAADERYSQQSARDWDLGKEGVPAPAKGRWANDRRNDREWVQSADRRPDRTDRDRPWEQDRYPQPRRPQRDRQNDRNGRDREISPPIARQEQPFAGWSPDPASNGNGEAFAPRPPSRMGRTEPAPLLSRDHPSSSVPNRDGGELTLKRARSPDSGRRSPPAGLLKRKANFNAVVPPALTSAEKEGLAAIENVAPGAPIQPRINTLESPVMSSNTGSAAAALPGSHPGSTLPAAASSTVATPAAAVPADANFTTTCDALDDTSVPSVRLSCLPRKLPHAPALSGRERRKARGSPIPLDQRKFVGCSSLDDYEISIKLGQGTFGEVLKGRQILTGTQVALKKVTIHDAKDGLPITALREIKLLKKLKHPSIVPVIDMAYRPSGERGKLGDVYMVEPYMDHDLNGMLENPSIRLENSQIKLYMKQLLEGTLYLHKNRILHRDMKAANLLINNKGQLQIADFGLARPYRDPGQSWTGKGWTGGTHRYTNMVVTRWYRPPELLAGEKKYGPPIDMWGIGCILAEMVMGKPLFKGTSEINQLELIAQLCGSPNETSFPGWSSLPGVKDADPTGRPDPHPEIPGQHEFGAYTRKVKERFRTLYDAGPHCADLIDKLLVLDPKKRLTAQQALEHEWFWTKPFPADPASLPKYEHSKEIDRARREWKPAPAAAAPAPAIVPGPGAMGPGGGMMGGAVRPQQQQPPQQQQQQQQQQAMGMGYMHPGPSQQRQPRPFHSRAPYAPPQQSNGIAPMGMQQSDGWVDPSGPLNYGQAGRPNMAYPGPRPFPPPNNVGGGGRHPFPGQHGQPQGNGGGGGGGSRFPHPSRGRPFPQPPPPHQHQPQHQQHGMQPHGLPPRPRSGGPQNPYSM